ncbi:MAG: hypothetical protein ACKOGA_01840, partial [Planctomycetaceae bacterium]
MAEPSSLESLHLPYVGKILDALVVTPAEPITPKINSQSSRNAASHLTALLCHRLAQTGQVTESTIEGARTGKT